MLMIREAVPVEFDSVAAILTAVWPANPIDSAELTRDHSTMEQHLRPRFAIAQIDSQAVGVCELWRDIGSFHPERWTVVVSVLPVFRRLGIGEALYRWSKDELASVAVQTIESKAHEDDPAGQAFAARHGFTETKRDFVSELILRDRNPPPVTLPPGLEIRPFAAIDDAGMRRRLHATFEEVRADVPRAYPPTPTPYDFFDEHVLGDPNFLAEATFLALDAGEVAGFTGAFRAVEEGVVDQWLTAVRRPWRNRGVALCLKVEGIRWAKANGYTMIRTDNDSRNARMLAINERLGFIRRCGLIRYQWTATTS